ncbi:MAG: glyceraldehyde-3-phosphate dehydrogenase, type [Bacteroidetes bacterium]|nr:glyceraldehyde-3-phosphate dehydrogenase, type [Bacteroidota bacterium]
MIKVAINGFGRIGRLTFRKITENDQLEVVAINDLSAPSMLAYLLKYDSVQGTFKKEVGHTENALVIDGREIAVYAERDPHKLPWGDLQVDLVLECTGIFESREKASAHLEAGARKVIISAPSDKDVKTIVYNVNHHLLHADDRLISCASCTTNCLAPMAQVLNEKFGIVAGQMTTIHAYTNSQPLMDTPDPKVNYRKSRAAGDSIVPYTTGAAKAIGLVIPELKGKLDGSSQRVPVHSGSVVELFTFLRKTVSVEEVNAAMKAAANESYGYTEDPIVSSDVIGISFGSLFDATQTKIVTAGDKQMVKTVSWYDNEMSFVSQMVRTAAYFGAL